MTWPGPQLLSWGRGIKRPGLELGWKRKGGDTAAAFLHPQAAPLVPGSPHLPWPPKVPFLVLPLAQVAPFAPLDLFSPDRFLRSMLRA